MYKRPRGQVGSEAYSKKNDASQILTFPCLKAHDFERSFYIPVLPLIRVKIWGWEWLIAVTPLINKINEK